MPRVTGLQKVCLPFRGEMSNLQLAGKAEDQITNICNKLGITDAGKNWLDVALDPFKDIRQHPIGFPDQIATPSVVETINDSFVISAPSSASGGNWDANIFLDKLYLSEPLTATTQGPFGTFQQNSQTGPTYYRGGLVVRSASSGTLLDITQTTFESGLKTDLLLNAQVRVLAIGMEIHNTSANILKQGAICCWRILDDKDDTSRTANLVGNTATPTAGSCVPLVELPEVPETIAQAIDLDSSLQWDAKEGAYIVPILADSTNKPQTQSPTYYSDVPDSGGSGYGTIIDNTDVVYYPGNSNFNHSFSVSGAYLTGLENDNTLQVNVKYYVEIFPNKDNTLKRLAHPSCPLDAKALELYTKVAGLLPTGCSVKDNFIGAFIAGVARVAQMVMPSLIRGAAFVARNSKAIGQVLQGGATVANALMSGDSVPYTKTLSLPSPSPKLTIEQPKKTKNNEVKKEVITVTNTKKGPVIEDLVITKPKNNNNNNNIVIHRNPTNNNQSNVIRSVQYVNKPAPKRYQNEFYVDKAIRGNNWINKK